jgi:prepilin-type processing-associated H-X9-DG protein
LSYGYNRDLWWWQDKNVAHPKMDTFKRPTQILMVADFWHCNTREPVRPDPKPWNFPGSHHGGSASTTPSHTHEGGGLGGTYGSFAFRHTQKLNMGYADGHVRASSRRSDNRPTQHRFLDTSTFWE